MASNEDDQIKTGITYALELVASASVEVDKSVTPEVTSTVTTGAQLVWASDKESVAAVDKNGVVTGVAVGTANITAKIVLNGVELASKDLSDHCQGG